MWERQVHHVFVESQLKTSDLHRLSVAAITSTHRAQETWREIRLPDPVGVILYPGQSLLSEPRHAATRALRRSLRSPWPEVRYLSVMYLQTLDTNNVCAPLMSVFNEEQNEDVRIRMLRTFGETVYLPALGILSDQFNYPREKMTEEAQSALAMFSHNATGALLSSLPRAKTDDIRAQRVLFILKLGDNGHLDVLLPYLTNVSVSDDIRSAACIVLGKFRYSQIIPCLIDILAEGRIRYTNLCLAVKDALEEFGQPGVEAITKGIEHAESGNHRANLIWALMRSNAHGAIPILTTCLKDPDVTVRRHAISALQQVEGVSSADKLLPFLDDETTRGEALLALEKLANQSFHNDVDACKKWWRTYRQGNGTEPQPAHAGDGSTRAR